MARKLGGTALELGCGTGRVLAELARGRCPVVGLDSSQAMLDRLRSKLEQDKETATYAELIQGDMRNFQLGRRFQLIYSPFREFMHLMNPADQLACLNCCYHHLENDGRLIINLYDFDLPLVAGQMSMDVPLRRQRMGDYTDPESGHRVLLSSSSAYRWEDQSLIEERFYDRIDADGRVVERRCITLTQRWYTRYELQHLFFRAGFRVSSLMGGYNGESKVTPGGESIWILRPASQDELEDELVALQDRIAHKRSPRSSKTRSRKTSALT